MKSALVFCVVAAVFMYVSAMPADGDATPAVAVTPAPGADAPAATPAAAATPAPGGDAPTDEPPTANKPSFNPIEEGVNILRKNWQAFLNLWQLP